MKSLVSIILVAALTGCATPPRFLAASFNSGDVCQNYRKDPTWQLPSYCGSGNRTTIYSTPHGAPLGYPVGYVK